MAHNTWTIKTYLSSLTFLILLFKLRGNCTSYFGKYCTFILLRPNKFKIINMNIPIVKWTNPMTKEVFTDKVLISPYERGFHISHVFLRFSAPTS